MAYDNAPKKKFAEDYIDVAERLRAWYEAYPNARIETEIVSLSDKQVVVKAWAYRGETADEKPAGTGHASMAIPGSTPYTRGSELENTETSAVGRALVMAGLPSKKVASGDEIRSKSVAPKAEKVDPVVAAAKEIFNDDPALLEWRDAINASASSTDLTKVAQEIAASALDADQKRWLGQYYTARKAELGA